MIFIPISTEKGVIFYEFSATLVPSDILYSC